MMSPGEKQRFIALMRNEEAEWCLALHGNHDEHQCHKKPGHLMRDMDDAHECYCGVWW